MITTLRANDVTPEKIQNEWYFLLEAAANLQSERCFLMGMIQLMLSLLLYCSSLTIVNEAIVQNIWRCCLGFTLALLIFFYRKKITQFELVAALTIMLCALLIGFGGVKGKTNFNVGPGENCFVERTHLLFAVCFAMYTGVLLVLKNSSSAG